MLKWFKGFEKILIKKEDIYTVEYINDYHTVILTELGQKLYDEAKVVQDRFPINVKEIEHKGNVIKFQYLYRQFFGTPAPDTYDVEIR